MAGINRFYSTVKYSSRSSFLANGITCVFISHQKKDAIQAKKIADYLIAADINVYFDEYDTELRIHHQSNNPKSVTSSILKGINNSSHMLVIVSPNTINSQWVPFEIGYGYGKTDLSIMCLKGIPQGGLPEYVRSAKIIRDLYDLDELIPVLAKKSKELLLEQRKMFSYSDIRNPLSGVMDGLINDQY